MKKKFLAILFILAFVFSAQAIRNEFTVQAALHPTIFVGGVEITEQNASDVLGDGTVSYDNKTNTLTLNNAIITEYYTGDMFGEEGYYGIYCESNDVKVQLIGENTIRLTNDKMDDSFCDLYASGDIKISGNGSLSLTSFNAIVSMGNIIVEDCSLESTVQTIVCLGEVSIENATVEGEYSAVGANADVTIKSSTIIGGENAIIVGAGGTLVVEDSTIVVINGQFATPIEVNGSATIKNSTLEFCVNATEEESVQGIYASNQLTLENVQADIEVRTEATQVITGINKVTITKSNINISAVALDDSAIGIFSTGNIKIEESDLEISVRGSKDLSSAIGSMGGNLEIKDSKLNLSSFGPCAVGILGVNVNLVNCDGVISATANGNYDFVGAGIYTIEGNMNISGGVLEINAIGTTGNVMAGILIEGVSVPIFVNTSLTIRSSEVALFVAPNLNLYGREYEITVSEDVDCDTPAEYNVGNIQSYKYFNIHGWYTITFNANGGTGTMQSEDGYCGRFILPKNGFTAPEDMLFKGWALTSDGEVIEEEDINVYKDVTLYAIWEENPHEHNFAPATCTTPKTCDCGLAEGEPLGHKFGGEWKNNQTEHFKACECGEKQYQGAHVDTNKNGSCDVCGYQMGKAKEKGCKGSINGSAIAGLAILFVSWFFIRKKRC